MTLLTSSKFVKHGMDDQVIANVWDASWHLVRCFYGTTPHVAAAAAARLAGC